MALILILWAAMAGVIAVLVALLLPPGALAHDAPSGWTYPTNCCNNMDCRVIRPSDLILSGNTVTIRETGERFLLPGHETEPLPASYTGHAHWSGDALHPDSDYHRCSSGYPERGTGVTWCLYLPRPST